MSRLSLCEVVLRGRSPFSHQLHFSCGFLEAGLLSVQNQTYHITNEIHSIFKTLSL
jgi:hypothetical protein